MSLKSDLIPKEAANIVTLSSCRGPPVAISEGDCDTRQVRAPAPEFCAPLVTAGDLWRIGEPIRRCMIETPTDLNESCAELKGKEQTRAG